MILSLAHGATLEMARIPAGEFWMGADIWSEKERPKHLVTLPDYYMGKTVVTVAQYAVFVKAAGYRARPGQVGGLVHNASYPVVLVNWYDAKAFCKWVDETALRGREGILGWQARLPGEAEWEKAARGTDGQEYPWGNQPPDDTLCNFNGSLGQLTPVGFFSPQGDSPYGLNDMAGNVWEWTHSLFRPYPYSTGDGREDDQQSGERVVRGGSVYNYSGFLRCSYRLANAPERSYTSRGFRICVSPIRF
jgi:formylglycine-generating enzyme required for sulfatase activity